MSVSTCPECEGRRFVSRTVVELHTTHGPTRTFARSLTLDLPCSCTALRDDAADALARLARCVRRLGRDRHAMARAELRALIHHAAEILQGAHADGDAAQEVSATGGAA